MQVEDIEKKVDSLVEEVEQVADDVEEVVGKEAAEQKWMKHILF